MFWRIKGFVCLNLFVFGTSYFVYSLFVLRFDKIIEVTGTRDIVTQERILRAASRNLVFTDDVDLKEIVCHDEVNLFANRLS